MRRMRGTCKESNQKKFPMILTHTTCNTDIVYCEIYDESICLKENNGTSVKICSFQLFRFGFVCLSLGFDPAAVN